MIVVDTSAIIELINGSEKGEKIKELLEKEPAAISSITVNEILIGCKKKERSILYNFFKSLHILPFDSEAAFRSVEIEEYLNKKGKTIGKLDIFIAATCLINSLPILTLDKDFKNIDDLNVILI